MKEENKKSKSIPDWFDLNKYEAGKNLPLVDWALNLIVRKRIFFRELCEEHTASYMDLIKKHGFLTRSNVKDIYEEAKKTFNLREIKPGLGLVNPLSLSRAVDIYYSILRDTELRNRLAIIDSLKIFDSNRSEPLQSREVRLKEWYSDNKFRGQYGIYL